MDATPRRVTTGLAVVATLSIVAGCATAEVTNPSKADPYEAINRPIFAFNDTLDRYALRPVARIYDRIVPEVVQFVLGNVFSNLADVYTAANQLLQGKPLNGLQDLSRFVINSTWGMLGFGDVASAMGLRKHHEDFGQTLGVWGVPSGPYVVVPFLGPSTARDAPALAVDARFDLLWQGAPDVASRNAGFGLRLAHQRAALLETERTLRGLTLDRYTLIRDGYLQRRNSAVYDGSPPDELPDYGDEDYDAPSPADDGKSGPGSARKPGKTEDGNGADRDGPARTRDEVRRVPATGR